MFKPEHSDILTLPQVTLCLLTLCSSAFPFPEEKHRAPVDDSCVKLLDLVSQVTTRVPEDPLLGIPFERIPTALPDSSCMPAVTRMELFDPYPQCHAAPTGL